MPSYQDLGNGNFQKTTSSSEQINVGALQRQIAVHQSRIDLLVADLQGAAAASVPAAQPALDMLTTQPLSSTLGKTTPLTDTFPAQQVTP